jgi:hypothetical protein
MRLKILLAALGAALLIGGPAQAAQAPGTGCQGADCRAAKERCVAGGGVFHETTFSQADGSTANVGWCQSTKTRRLDCVGVQSCGLLKELCIKAKGRYSEASSSTSGVAGTCKLPPKTRAVTCGNVSECGVLGPACISAGHTYYEETSVGSKGELIVTGRCEPAGEG